MKAKELKKVVMTLNASESKLATEKDKAKILTLKATVKDCWDKLTHAANESEGEGENEGEAGATDGSPDMEAEGMEALKESIPQHEGEEDEAYKSRLAKAMKTMQGMFPAKQAEGVIPPKPKSLPAVHSEDEDPVDGDDGNGDGAPAAGDTHIHLHGKEAKELTDLRRENAEFKKAQEIGQLKAKALRLITEANVPTDFLSPSDLLALGKDESAWKRTIARTKAALEGGTFFSSILTEKEGTPTGELKDDLVSSFRNAGIPVKIKD